MDAKHTDQLTCEWRCLCDCGLFRLVPAQTQAQAESRLRECGWRKVEGRWACGRCNPMANLAGVGRGFYQSRAIPETKESRNALNRLVAVSVKP